MKVQAKSYTLRTIEGYWLGQIVLTSDGMFSSVTDYGNLSFAWRHYDNEKSLEKFEDFILNLNTDYFSGKMFCGVSYMSHSNKAREFCDRYSKKILPSLQEEIKKSR